jgi:hypothetical protein
MRLSQENRDSDTFHERAARKRFVKKSFQLSHFSKIKGNGFYTQLVTSSHFFFVKCIHVNFQHFIEERANNFQHNLPCKMIFVIA